MASFDVGGVEGHEPLLRDLVSSFPNMVGWRAGLVLFLAEVGRLDEARHGLSNAIANEDLERARPNEWHAVAAALSLASAELGDRATAASLYEALLPHASNLFVVGYSSYCGGSTHRLLGVLACAMEEWELARAHFERAISRNAAIRADACNGRVHFDYSRMLDLVGDAAGATHQATRAREIALGFGMKRLLARVEPYLHWKR
jgi:hypothetical protein